MSKCRYNLSEDCHNTDCLNCVLDKIRDEIEQEYTKFCNKSDIWNERACGLGTALEIIDKYKASLTGAEGSDKE